MHASSSHTHSSSHHKSRSHLPVEGSFCRYSHRICMQNKLDGYEYCIKHILEDSNATYKQCNYISNKTGKRCINAAARTERKDGYCLEHTRRTILLRQKASRKRKPPETPDTLLDDLDFVHHRANPPEVRRARSLESLASRILGSQHGVSSHPVMFLNLLDKEPFRAFDLEYASSSDSDMDGAPVECSWRGDCDSDAESVDSEQEDPLKHAGIYTAEEVALLTRDKLIRLQSLYIDQFKRLQHLLKEKRRNYLHTVRMDREQYGSVSSAKDDPEQRDAYDKLQAMKRYHKRFGKESLLHRQSQERRKQVSEGLGYHPPSYPKCTHQKADGSKCSERTVPLAKFCFQHILEDQFQVLFRPCHYGDGSCQEPTAALHDTESRCPFHTPIQTHEHRLPKRQSSEESNQSSREGDTVDVTSVDAIPLLVATHTSHRQSHIKQGNDSSASNRQRSIESAMDMDSSTQQVKDRRRSSQAVMDNDRQALQVQDRRRASHSAMETGRQVQQVQDRRKSSQAAIDTNSQAQLVQDRRISGHAAIDTDRVAQQVQDRRRFSETAMDTDRPAPKMQDRPKSSQAAIDTARQPAQPVQDRQRSSNSAMDSDRPAQQVQGRRRSSHSAMEPDRPARQVEERPKSSHSAMDTDSAAQQVHDRRKSSPAQQVQDRQTANDTDRHSAMETDHPPQQVQDNKQRSSQAALDTACQAQQVQDRRKSTPTQQVQYGQRSSQAAIDKEGLAQQVQESDKKEDGVAADKLFKPEEHIPTKDSEKS